ncbi:MAG: cytochrome C assembly protein [Nitrospirae bacterium]|nr:MAG: cytochrome C assembly protein [Nitrospirota bacterium]
MRLERLHAAANAAAVVAGVAIVAALYMVFEYVPMERTMGNVQRIFYFHVPSAMVSFLAFFICFLASLVYLFTRGRGWDVTAHAAAEIGVVFCSIVLITGPIWAKPIWGIWWTWDARLTTTLVLWLIYVAYLMLRAYLPEGSRRANLAAVVGILGFVDVPIVYMSIRWWRTQHPKPVIMGGKGSGLAPPMATTLEVCMVAMLCLFVALLLRRIVVELLQDEVDHLYREADLAPPERA